MPGAATTETVYAPFHPVPFLRMGLGFLSTGWILAALKARFCASPILQAWAGRMLSVLNIQVTYATPIPPGGQLWVSNHLSWVDPLVYLSLRPCRVMAKAEVADYPAIGSGARRIGLRFVKRENPFSRACALRTLLRDLKAGEAFLVFPEGTTTHGDHLAPLYEGSLRMAFRMGITVLPLRLASLDAQYPWVGDAPLFPHLKGLAWSRGTRVCVHPGEVLDPQRFQDEQAWLRSIRSHLETPEYQKDTREH